MKKKRESLDSRLAKLSRNQQMNLLIYGDAGPGNAVDQLARRARALRGIAKALNVKLAPLSESYQYGLRELTRQVNELCVPALLDNDRSFFRRLAVAMRRVDSERGGWSEAHEVRLLLRWEERNGRVNLQQFSKRLKKLRGVQKDVRSLSRICQKLRIATLPRGRPRKPDK